MFLFFPLSQCCGLSSWLHCPLRATHCFLRSSLFLVFKSLTERLQTQGVAVYLPVTPGCSGHLKTPSFICYLAIVITITWPLGVIECWWTSHGFRPASQKRSCISLHWELASGCLSHTPRAEWPIKYLIYARSSRFLSFVNCPRRLWDPPSLLFRRYLDIFHECNVAGMCSWLVTAT